MGTSTATDSPPTTASQLAGADLVNMMVSVTAVAATSPVTSASLHWEQSGSQCIVATATLDSSLTVSEASEKLSSTSLLATLDSFSDLTMMVPCRPDLM